MIKLCLMKTIIAIFRFSKKTNSFLNNFKRKLNQIKLKEKQQKPKVVH